MSATVTPPTLISQSATDRPGRSASREMLHPILVGLAVFVGIAGISLSIALVTGAVVAFNILIFVLFTVLWTAFAAALAFSPGTLDDLWHQIRRLPLVIQGVVWVLALPIMIGMWIWERTWSFPIRLVLIIALGAWNIFMFFPRSL